MNNHHGNESCRLISEECRRQNRRDMHKTLSRVKTAYNLDSLPLLAQPRTLNL